MKNLLVLVLVAGSSGFVLSAFAQRPFVTTWKTETSSESIEIPTTGGGYSYTVNWGDGNIDNTTYTGNARHTYANAATYTVSITGSFPRIYFNNTGHRNKILSITQWGDIAWTSMERAFYGCTNISCLATDSPNLSQVTNMSYMFAWTAPEVSYNGPGFATRTKSDDNLFNESIGNWDVSHVTDMSFMFKGVTSFNVDIGSWNVSHVTNMSFMFMDVDKFNTDIGNWDVSKVTNMSGMFQRAASFNKNISNWDVSQVTNMSFMFSGVSFRLETGLWVPEQKATVFNGDISGWNVGNVTSMGFMFANNVSFNQNINNWNVSQITNLSGMFADAISFNQDLNNWNVGNVTQMSGMFNNASAFNGNISNWNVSQVTDLSFMFGGAKAFNRAIGGWSIGNATDLSFMFFDAVAFNQSIGNWNVSQVKNMEYMFFGASSFNQGVGNWNVGSVMKMNAMFAGAEKFNQDVGLWDVRQVEMMDYVFYQAKAFNRDIGAWEVGSVKSMCSMFEGAASFNQNITNWNIRNESLLPGASSTENIIWTVGKRELRSSGNGMTRMFYGAALFNQNLGAWQVGNIIKMQEMFSYAGLSPANYEATLTGWATQTLRSGVTLGADGLRYCGPSIARNKLTTIFQWNIIGDISWCDEREPFVTVWKSNNSGQSAANQIIIPGEGTGYNYNIYWEQVDAPSNHGGITGQKGGTRVTFPSPGTYRVEIRGQFPRIRFNGGGDRQKILSIENWGDITWTSMEQAFKGCSNLTQTTTDVPNLSGVTSLASMFYEATSFNGNVESWDVSHVTNMEYMFYGAATFNRNLSNWEISKVTSLQGTFKNAQSFDQDLGVWVVSSVINMTDMLSGSGLSPANYDATLSGWATQTLKSGLSLGAAGRVYCSSESARNILTNSPNEWIISGDVKSCSSTEPFVTIWKSDNPGTSASNQIKIPTSSTAGYYNYSIYWEEVDDPTNHGTLSAQSGSATVSFPSAGRYRIAISGSFPQIYFNNGGDRQKILSIEQWGDMHWTSMQDSFEGCVNLSCHASDAPDLSGVTNMTGMFREATIFNGAISHWDVSGVVNMNSMFQKAVVFNQNIANWNVGHVADMTGMFNEAKSFNQYIGDWDISHVTNMENMLSNAGISPAFYDSILTGWASGNPHSGVKLGSSGLWYCEGHSAREILVNDFGWTIVGDGKWCDGGRPFITTWKTNNEGNSGNNQITISTWEIPYKYHIYWEEVDNTDNHSTLIGLTGDVTISFPSPGIYRVEISGLFPGIAIGGYAYGITGEAGVFYTSDFPKIISIDQWGDISWKTMLGAFSGCYNLTYNATDVPDLSHVTNMGSMFFEATLFDGSIGNWNVSNVTNMSSMFEGASSFNQDIDNWDVSNVTDMHAMFAYSKFNNEIGSWDVSKVRNMSEMFQGSPFNKDLNNWDVSQVVDMRYMFKNARAFNGNISNWDVQNVTNMREMFHEARSFNKDLNNWNVGRVTNMMSMFYNTKSFNGNISSWDVSKVTDMGFMFTGAEKFNQNIGNWNVGKVTTMRNMFGIFESVGSGYFTMNGAILFDQDISKWNVSQVKDMTHMFAGTFAFNQDLSSWDVGNVTNMRGMFFSSKSFNQNLGDWNINQVSSMNYMLSFTNLSTANYDSTLIGWASKNPKANVQLDADDLTYCLAENARKELVETYKWVIGWDEKKCTSLITGIEVDDSSINVFPNPSTEYVVVEFSEVKPGRSIELIDIAGRSLFRQPAAERENKIEMLHYPTGNYILLVHDQQANAFRLVKK